MARPKTAEEIQQSINLMRAENKLKSTNDQIRAQNIEKIHTAQLELESDYQIDAETGEEIDAWDDDLDEDDEEEARNNRLREDLDDDDISDTDFEENGDDEDQPNSPFQKHFLRDGE